MIPLSKNNGVHQLRHTVIRTPPAMLRAIGTLMSERFRRWMPDPFVFAILLTIGVAMLALMLTPSRPLLILESWYRGFWNLLEFGMQMVLILATGYAIALSPVVARFVDAVAHRVNTPARVYFIVMVVGGLFSLVSWGWGVLTAVLARELAQRVPGSRLRVPYRLCLFLLVNRGSAVCRALSHWY